MLRAKGHEVVLHDLVQFDTGGASLIQGDAQVGDGFERGCAGADVVVHLPAWHGIHWRAKTEKDFWRLNVNGTFELFQAAVVQGVKKVVFLSSTAWYGHYDKYGFTKVIGEELCEYYHRNHKVKVARVRPSNFTPWNDFLEYGRRFITGGGVDREDVLDIVVRAVESDAYENEVFHAQRDNWVSADERAAWPTRAAEILEAKVPGAAALVGKYGIDLKPLPEEVNVEATKRVLGWTCRHDFVTFLKRLKALDQEGGEARVRAERGGY